MKICAVCTFANSQFLADCEICGAPLPVLSVELLPTAPLPFATQPDSSCSVSGGEAVNEFSNNIASLDPYAPIPVLASATSSPDDRPAFVPIFKPIASTEGIQKQKTKFMFVPAADPSEPPADALAKIATANFSLEYQRKLFLAAELGAKAAAHDLCENIRKDAEAKIKLADAQRLLEEVQAAVERQTRELETRNAELDTARLALKQAEVARNQLGYTSVTVAAAVGQEPDNSRPLPQNKVGRVRIQHSKMFRLTFRDFSLYRYLGSVILAHFRTNERWPQYANCAAAHVKSSTRQKVTLKNRLNRPKDRRQHPS